MGSRAGLDLTLACGHYDRTEGLRDGTVRIEGVNLTYLDLPVEETFFRMARFGEFDLAELSLSSYVISLDRDAPFIAIPAFPSRMFRHSGIYLNTAAGIAAPGDLAGRTVGLAEYQLTANVWIRGILAEHYGVPVPSVHYRTGGLHRPGRVEKLALQLPDGLRVTPIGPGQTLADMLVSGEIDALYTPRTPEPFRAGRPEVARLFPDAGAEERRYYQQTGIFPVMHVVVLRRDLYDRHRWLARSVLKAFEQARRQALDGLDETAALRYLLPWLHEEVERTRTILGPDYWSYGLAANDAPLRTFLRYAREQGLIRTAFEPADLFAPETLEDVVV
jgi:4,5-dihydroxyphthalate decarboxylase